MLRKSFKAALLLVLSSLLIVACNDDSNVIDGDIDSDSTDGDVTESDDSDGDQEIAEADDVADGDTDIDEEQENELDSTEDVEAEAEEEGPWVLPYSSPETRGSYNAGAKQVRFVNEEQERDLLGFIWYPTTETGPMGFNYDSIIPTEGAIYEPEIADGGPFPVVVFSHGSQAFSQQSFYLTEYLATHGFIVAAPNHVGNTTATDDSSRMGYIAQQRPRDMSITIDHLEQWNEDPEHILYHKMNLDQIGGIGHSFGGFTMVYFAGGTIDKQACIDYCESLEDISDNTFCKLLNKNQIDQIDENLDVHDERVKAVVPQAPAGYAFFTDAGMKDIKIPVQFQVGDLDVTVPPSDSFNMYAAMNPVKQLLLLKGAGHFTFSNMCDLIPSLGDGCYTDGEGLDWEVATNVSNIYALSFIRVYVLGEERDKQYLTDEYASQYDFVEFSHEEKEESDSE